MAYYSLDPFGDQREDMRFARMTAHLMTPHLRQGASIDPRNLMLFPEDARDLPEDVTDEERQMMLSLSRLGGG